MTGGVDSAKKGKQLSLAQESYTVLLKNQKYKWKCRDILMISLFLLNMLLSTGLKCTNAFVNPGESSYMVTEQLEPTPNKSERKRQLLRTYVKKNVQSFSKIHKFT